MKPKTKIGFILIGVGFLIFLITIVLMLYEILVFSGDYIFLPLIIMVVAFVLIAIGGRMVKVRFNRWMETG